MRFSKLIFFFISMLVFQYCHTYDMLAGHQQLMVVTTRGWDDVEGRLRLYERAGDGEGWSVIEETIPVVLGKAGLAWGVGLHSISDSNCPRKVEGDRKSPAGLFSLGSAFGFPCCAMMTHLQIEYLHIDEYTEAVDDPKSRYYNCIVNRKEVPCDWRSSEKMSEIPLYAIGLVINHNFPNPRADAGSAIFMHIWRRERSGTLGCTAMSQENLAKILCWLERNKNPLLLQLPISVYCDLQIDWNLPKLGRVLS